MTARSDSNGAERLEALLDAAVDAIVLINSVGDITRFNPAAERLFGYSEADVMGRNVRMLMPQPYRGEHDDYMSRYLQTGRKRIIGIGREVVACRHDGSQFPIDLSVGEFRRGTERGFVGILRDISERHAQESRLRNKAEQLRLLLEHAPTPVVVTDPQGWIRNANAACVNLLGYDIESLRRMQLSDIVEAEDRDDVLSDLEQARAGSETHQREVRLRHRQGHSLPVLFYSGCGRDQDGRPLLIIAELLDRTALQQATREVDRLRDRLAHAARLGMLGEMVSGIAHEVNQPLAAISTYASACRRMLNAGQATPGELVEVLEKISRQAERAGQVIRGLRAMVRQRETERALLDLNPLVDEVVQLAEIDLRGSTQRLELELAPDLPCFLGDGVQIQQVLMNLIRNAAEAMRESGSGEEVRVSTRLGADGMLELCVSDQGPGVAPEVEARLFDPFLTTKSQGMGLGLSICKSIMQAHAGDLTYRRRTGGGAQFLARLPVAPNPDIE